MYGPDFSSSTHHGIASLQNVSIFKFTTSSQGKNETGCGFILSNNRWLSAIWHALSIWGFWVRLAGTTQGLWEVCSSVKQQLKAGGMAGSEITLDSLCFSLSLFFPKGLLSCTVWSSSCQRTQVFGHWERSQESFNHQPMWISDLVWDCVYTFSMVRE